jgi:glycolate oxidase iron-sulfur subunit
MAIAAPEPLTFSHTIPPRDSGIDLDWLTQKIDYRRFQDCVHCGLCTASCPTYIETSNENDSPRGRIYLMRAVVDGRLGLSREVRAHLELCLDCRACESACPSGVQYGHLIEPFKVAIHQSDASRPRASGLQRFILRHVFPYRKRVKAALGPARILQRLGVLGFAERMGLTRLLPPTLRRMQAMLPQLSGVSGKLPEVLPPIGPRRARVALFLGCVADAIFPETNAAAARVLQQNGCEVIIPHGQVCCGAIHYHSGVEEPALAFARQNLDTFNPDEYDAVIVNVAGCGAMLKDYAHLLPPSNHNRAARFVAKVRDVSEFLIALGPMAPAHHLPIKVTYHDACHLCHAQQVRSQPRQLLAMIPGLELIPLEESEICCGAAGTYNLTQPEMSDRLGRRKLEHIEATGAEVVATGNVGCILQIARQVRERGARIEVVHPIDLLDRAYRRKDFTAAGAEDTEKKTERTKGIFLLGLPLRARRGEIFS